jgi:hypothetical protein
MVAKKICSEQYTKLNFFLSYEKNEGMPEAFDSQTSSKGQCYVPSFSGSPLLHRPLVQF